MHVWAGSIPCCNGEATNLHIERLAMKLAVKYHPLPSMPLLCVYNIGGPSPTFRDSSVCISVYVHIDVICVTVQGNWWRLLS